MRIIYSIILFSLFGNILNGQIMDHFKIIGDFSVSILQTDLVVDNLYESSSKYRDSKDNLIKRFSDTSINIKKVVLHVGTNIPIYRTKKWSIGTKLYLGYGGLIFDSESGTLLDFPVYFYYRNYGTDFDFSLLLGYQYTLAPLPYQLGNMAFEFHFLNQMSIRLYGSFTNYKYYYQFTDGNTNPMIKYTEFGIAICANIF